MCFIYNCNRSQHCNNVKKKKAFSSKYKHLNLYEISTRTTIVSDLYVQLTCLPIHAIFFEDSLSMN